MKKITTERMELEEFNEEMKSLDLSYNNLNGALGIVFNADANWIIKLNFATGYRAPNLSELSSNGVHEGTVRYELGNPEMESENNYQLDAGIIFRNKRVRVSLSGFYNNIKNFIYLQSTTDSLHGYQVFKFIQTDSYLFGGEATFDLRPIYWFDINASYSIVIGKKSDDSYLPFIPADKIITKLKFLAGNISVFNNFEVETGIRGYLKQNRVTGNELSTPGSILLDLGINSDFYWGKQPIIVSLTATNILNKLYINHLSLLRPLGLYDIGRNISLSVTVPVDYK